MADTAKLANEEERPKPQLAIVLRVKDVIIKKKNEWGFVLRGTTTQYGSSLRIYTCRIEKVNQGGPADVSHYITLLLQLFVPLCTNYVYT